MEFRITSYNVCYTKLLRPGMRIVKILSENNYELNSITIIGDKGFNYAEYDLTLTELGKTELMNDNTDLEINKASSYNFV